MPAPFLLLETPVATLAEYKAAGGGEAYGIAQRFGRDETINELAASGLRGRGGGGFPTGQKWAGIRDAGPGRRFVVANGAEGEPGTFKDRALLRHNPYQVLEGLSIAALVLGAEAAYVATKAAYAPESARLANAIEEMRADGSYGSVPITLVLGPD